MTHCTYDKNVSFLSFIFEYSMRPVVFKISYPRFWLSHWSSSKDTYFVCMYSNTLHFHMPKVRKRKHKRYHREYSLRPDTLFFESPRCVLYFSFFFALFCRLFKPTHYPGRISKTVLITPASEIVNLVNALNSSLPPTSLRVLRNSLTPPPTPKYTFFADINARTGR